MGKMDYLPIAKRHCCLARGKISSLHDFPTESLPLASRSKSIDSSSRAAWAACCLEASWMESREPSLVLLSNNSLERAPNAIGRFVKFLIHNSLCRTISNPMTLWTDFPFLFKDFNLGRIFTPIVVGEPSLGNDCTFTVLLVVRSIPVIDERYN